MRLPDFYYNDLPNMLGLQFKQTNQFLNYFFFKKQHVTVKILPLFAVSLAVTKQNRKFPV